MIEVTIKLRYDVELPAPDIYPLCLNEQDCADHDKRAFVTGQIDLRDLLTWANIYAEEQLNGILVNNSENLTVEFAVVPPHDPGTEL